MSAKLLYPTVQGWVESPLAQHQYIRLCHEAAIVLSQTSAHLLGMAALNAFSTHPEASPSVLTNVDRVSQKSFSCVLCAQRKVKCDRRPAGCINCSKARVPCIYRAPPPPRRRKKGEQDLSVGDRILAYEEALHRLGVSPDEVVKQAIAKKQNPGSYEMNSFLRPHKVDRQEESTLESEAGILVSEQGRSRYLENGIWTSLQTEFRDTKEILDESSDEEYVDGVQEDPSPDAFLVSSPSLLFGTQSPSIALRPWHPDPAQIFKLWQSYLDNVNPLVKLFHAPTVQQMISNAAGNLEDLPRNLEALMFGIYCVSAESLTEDQCCSILGCPKVIALQRFRSAAQYALAHASLLRTSDLMVLQAFVLFILSLQHSDARVTWIWAGVSQRIGQRMGLHCDGGKLGVPPFEAEMRRRTWWQIMMLEGYSQKLAGMGSTSVILIGDVNIPLNVNDSALFQDMKEPPIEHEGATEMMFFLMRCHVADFLKRSADTQSNFDGLWNKLAGASVPMSIKDKAIGELEAILEEKFLRYCDRSIPWHFLCSELGKSIVGMMRFTAHSSGYYSMALQQSEKDRLFNQALQVVSAQNLAYTMKEMQGFIWHISLQFQWKAFIFVLSELRSRTSGAEVDRAWKQVEMTMTSHPSFGQALGRRALSLAVGTLTLKAWQSYVEARGLQHLQEPRFIQNIRSQQSRGKNTEVHLESPVAGLGILDVPRGRNAAENLIYDNDSWSTEVPEISNLPLSNTGNHRDLEHTPVVSVPQHNTESLDWVAWDSLLVDFQAGDAGDMAIDWSTFDLGIQ